LSWGHLSGAQGDEIIDVVNRIIKKAEEAGSVIVYTRDWHPEIIFHSKHMVVFGHLTVCSGHQVLNFTHNFIFLKRASF